MIEGKWFAPSADAEPCFALRRAVFDRGRDALDDESWNVVVWQGDEAAATGRLWWQDGAFHLGDVAVRSDLRGRMLGDLTLRLLLFKAESHAARLIRLTCPTTLCGFFARLGFKPEGRASQGMQPMLLRGEELCLDTCKECKKACPNRQAE